MGECSFSYVSVPCKEDEFECLSGYGCVESSMVCDNYPHCLHGSDEDRCGMCKYFRFYTLY